jgi:transcriptional regulator with XRE-family HTH domain
MDAGRLLREVRRRRGLDQRTLARLARTSQGQISRIERGEISPSVGTLARLLAAMGERLELRSVAPSPTPAERVAEAAELSHALTVIAAAAREQLTEDV